MTDRVGEQTNSNGEAGLYDDPSFWIEQIDDTTQEAVDFLIRELNPTPGARVLDLPCGYGRHSVELARRGYDVVGMDINARLLRWARDLAQRSGVAPHFALGDMRDASFLEKFDVVINLKMSLPHLGDGDCAKAMRVASDSLKPGGRFVLETFNRDGFVRHFAPFAAARSSEGPRLLVERRYDPLRGRCLDVRTILAGQRAGASVETDLRVYAPSELLRMCEAAGFRLRDAYGGYNGEALTIDSLAVVMILEKS